MQKAFTCKTRWKKMSKGHRFLLKVENKTAKPSRFNKSALAQI
jgi:hypothetical protein